MIFVGMQVEKICLPCVVGAVMVQNTCNSLSSYFCCQDFSCDILCSDAFDQNFLNIIIAESSYCMRKMLRRVPKGPWLCEECKFAEETDNQKQGKAD